MCGIFAVVARDRPVEEASVRRGLAALRHRGPDGTGLWLSPDRRAALGHVRLAFLDPATGAQPIASENGEVIVAVNGELYGHETVRAELEARGHRFRTGSDSEIVLHLYEEHGTEFLPRLRGEFAFVLWDQARRRLFAARDRFGVKPLCWTVAGGDLRVASEAKALFASGIPAAWDREAFFQSACVQYAPPDRTLFQGVRQLRPGHRLVADERGVQIVRWWDQDYPAAERPAVDAGEAARALRDALDEAVRLRLRGDAPVACQLSGGVDSSAVVALAMRHRGRPIDCFTVAFPGAEYDELAIAEETARHTGAQLHPVRVTGGDLAEHLAEAIADGEGLVINAHVSAKWILARAIRRAGFPAVLTGEGADEVLGGYAHLRRDLALAAPGGAAAVARLAESNRASAGTMLPDGAALPLDAVRRALGFVPSFLEAKATFGFRVRALLDEGFAGGFGDSYERFLADFDVPGQLAGRHPVDQALYLWSASALAQYILRTLGDGMEMAHGIEGRLPFLDSEVFAVARSLPIPLKIRDGVEKHVLREAVRGLVPERVRRREKHPFFSPPLSDACFRDGLRDRTPPFFDGEKLRALLDRLPGMDRRERVAVEPVLLTAFSAAVLHEHYRMGGA